MQGRLTPPFPDCRSLHTRFGGQVQPKLGQDRLGNCEWSGRHTLLIDQMVFRRLQAFSIHAARNGAVLGLQ